MIYEVSADDLLIFEDTALSNIKAETLEDTLNFVESILSNFHYLQISEYLPLSDFVVRNYTLTQTISDVLAFVDEAVPRTYYLEISDFLFIQDVLDNPIGGVIFENIDFTELLIIEHANGVVSDTLTFTDGLVLQIIGDKTLSESLQLSDSFTFILLNEDILDIPGNYVPDVINLNISLTDALETLEIHNPDFGDSETISYKRINKDLRGYERIIHPIQGWLPKESKKMTFSYLKEVEVNKLLAFWRRNVGKPVTLSDTYGTAFSVILQNPDFEVAQVGRFNRTLSLDFYIL